MKKILLLISILTGHVSIGANFFVDANTPYSIQNGSLANPWKGISQVNDNMGIFQPGDVISFKRGAIFTGVLVITKSGAADKAITFTNYGAGNLPIFHAQGLSLINIYNHNYIVIDGINLTDLNMDINNHYAECNTELGVEAYGNFIEIKNCAISLLGGGINLVGDNCYVNNNTIENLRMIKNTPVEQNANDDYGASAIIVSGSDNIIAHNILRDCWAYSYDYGYDGGGIEFYGGASNDNKIMYNTAVNCNGFNEFGSGDGGVDNNNLMAYNILINCGDLVYVNSGSYGVSATALKYYNNIIVETLLQFTEQEYMISINNSSDIDIKNNILYLITGVDVARNGIFNQEKNIHQNNVYRLSGGSNLNFAISANEKITSQLLFTNTYSTDPSQWNFMPLNTSAAINAGQWVGIDKDIINTPVASTPDAGAYEYITTTNIPPDATPNPPPYTPFVIWDADKITITSTRFDHYQLYNSIGQLLLKGIYKIGKTDINIRNFPHGLYLLKTEFKTYKIIK